jgi:hypothetical protein
MKNISGEFEIQLAGTKRKLKANFIVIEKLESAIWVNSSVTRKFLEAFQGNLKFNDLCSVIYLGLCAASDTRLNADQVGQALIEGGGVNAYLPTYIKFLQHFIDGGKQAENQNPL